MRLAPLIALNLIFSALGLSQDAPAGAVFNGAQAHFLEDIQTLRDTRGDEGYNTSDVNLVLKRTKEETLARVPKTNTPLRTYIERKFPQQVEPASPTVPTQEAEAKFGIVSYMLAKLTKLSSFHVNLVVNSSPPNARFELIPPVGSSLSTTTDSSLTNVYRGEYEYVITKTGYKTIRDKIDLIDRSGDTFDCDLQPQSNAEAALPCRFK